MNLKLTIYTVDEEVLEIGEYKYNCPVHLVILQKSKNKELETSLFFNDFKHTCFEPVSNVIERKEAALKKLSLTLITIVSRRPILEQTKIYLQSLHSELKKKNSLNWGFEEKINELVTKKEIEEQSLIKSDSDIPPGLRESNPNFYSGGNYQHEGVLPNNNNLSPPIDSFIPNFDEIVNYIPEHNCSDCRGQNPDDCIVKLPCKCSLHFNCIQESYLISKCVMCKRHLSEDEKNEISIYFI